MAALIPPSSNVEAAYEDMFKEITRKLYGEETGNGLHTLGTPVAQVATTGPTAPEGERSFTNLQIDRSSAPTIEYDHNAGNVAATAAVTAAAAAAAVVANAGANVVIQQQPEGSVVVATTGGGVAGGTVAGGGVNFKTEDHHLNTAFGLAALMQNGFTAATATPTGGNDPQQQQQQQQQQQPQIVQWTTTTGGKLQSYTTTQHQQQQQQQLTTPKSKSKNRNDHSATVVANTAEVIYTSPSTSGNAQQQQLTPATNSNTSGGGGGGGGGGGSSRKKSNSNQQNQNQQNGNNGNSSGIQIQKRYACTHCPYSTDRRDLYTRHENIHKDEKPFQCYACLKQFNRADHVKKHFLRMHREMQYDINKTRRHVPSTSTNHHSGGRGNVTINTTTANIQIDNAFLESQRQPTSSSLSIAETIEAVATAADEPLPQLKQEKNDDGSIVGASSNGTIKPKREKRFTCCYCPWSGADKWGLKRHLNTHTKPFVCLLCDYKAARSERLATHVLKVHNKRACNKCSFLADTQEEFQTHISEVHPHDNRPSRNSNNSNNNNNNNNSNNNSSSNNNTNTTANNLNVLRTIGNTLVTNNQLNTFQNSNATFGLGNSTTTTTVGNAGGSVTIYTTTTTDNGNIAGGGPLQEIIVNPTSMVGWRLSANGSLIPPHDLLTGGLPNAAAQKRGSERLFQYLEADGSDPEDYARLLKMDAISRNTASVAQDFHKAGGVQELKIPANHQLLFNNKLPSHWTTREAAALLHSLSNATHNSNINFAFNQTATTGDQRSKINTNSSIGNGGIHFYQPNGLLRTRQHSTGDDDENTPSSASSTTSSDGVSPMKLQQRHKVNLIDRNSHPTIEQRRAMTAFLSKNFDLQEKGNNSNNKTISISSSSNHNNNNFNKRKYQQTISHENSDVDNDDEQQDENQENQVVQLIRSSPAYNQRYNNSNNTSNNNNCVNHMKSRNNNNNNNSNNKNKRQQQQQQRNANNMYLEHQQQPQQHQQQQQQQHHQHQHRLDLFKERNRDKENHQSAAAAAATFLTQMEYQNLNKIGTQFQNYVKDIINKYYAETPLMFPAMPQATTTPQQAIQTTAHQQQGSPSKRRRLLSETEEYIEYLKNKEDITLTITPKNPSTPTANMSPATYHQQPATTIVRTNPNPKQLQQQTIPARQQQNARLSKPQKSIVVTPSLPLIQYQSTTLPLPPPIQQQHQVPEEPVAAATTIVNNNDNSNKSSRKSLSHLATLLPLLADAACQQEYLAAPLDFSKKASTVTNSTDTSPPPPPPAPAPAPAPPVSNLYAEDSLHAYEVNKDTESEASSRSLTPTMNLSCQDKRSSRKQAQPKKIRTPPELVMTMLRDKYLNRLMGHKLSCSICTKRPQMVFNYHTVGSLALHRFWKHQSGENRASCKDCGMEFKQVYSLRLHQRREQHYREIKSKKKSPRGLSKKVSNTVEGIKCTTDNPRSGGMKNGLNSILI